MNSFSGPYLSVKSYVTDVEDSLEGRKSCGWGGSLAPSYDSLQTFRGWTVTTVFTTGFSFVKEMVCVLVPPRLLSQMTTKQQGFLLSESWRWELWD